MSRNDKIIEMLADQLCWPKSMFFSESSLIDDIEADSLDIIELLICLEEMFGIELDDNDFRNINTVGDIFALADKLGIEQ
jgi:acyl carrier protein